MMVSRKNVEISAKIHEGEFRELLHCALWKLQNFTLTEKIFRQINHLVIIISSPILAKLYFHEVFAKKEMRVNVRNFHTVLCGKILHTVEITRFYCQGFSQNFRQIIILQKNFTTNWFDGKKFAWQWIFYFSTMCHSALWHLYI